MRTGTVRLVCATVVLAVVLAIDFMANLWQTVDAKGWDMWAGIFTAVWIVCLVTAGRGSPASPDEDEPGQPGPATVRARPRSRRSARR